MRWSYAEDADSHQPLLSLSCLPVDTRPGHHKNKEADLKISNGSSTRDRWARLRFSLIGPLLAAPPGNGELASALQALAARTWRHPVTGMDVTSASPLWSAGITPYDVPQTRWRYCVIDNAALCLYRRRSRLSLAGTICPAPRLDDAAARR